MFVPFSYNRDFFHISAGVFATVSVIYAAFYFPFTSGSLHLDENRLYMKAHQTSFKDVSPARRRVITSVNVASRCFKNPTSAAIVVILQDSIPHGPVPYHPVQTLILSLVCCSCRDAAAFASSSRIMIAVKKSHRIW